MKTKSLLFLSLILTSICFSCSESNSDSDTDPVKDVSLVGKWEIVIYRIYEDGKLSTTLSFNNEAFMEFKSDGKLIISQKNEDDEILTWKKLSSTKLLIDTQEYEITVRSKNEINIKQISGFPFDQFEFELKRR